MITPTHLTAEQRAAVSQCLDWYSERVYSQPHEVGPSLVSSDDGWLVRYVEGHELSVEDWCARYADYVRRRTHVVSEVDTSVGLVYGRTERQVALVTEGAT